MPKFDTPKIGIPDMPKFDAPKFMPDMSKLNVPKFDMPKVPEMPKDMPSFTIPGTATPEELETLEPQEVRDDRARAARTVFLEYDDAAKVSDCM